jgi:hypothetical protein
VGLISKARAIETLTDSLFYICNERQCLVPSKSIKQYQYHIQKWNPSLERELEVGLTLEPVDIDGFGITYKGDDDKKYRLDVDWQVRSELQYGFLTMNHLQGFDTTWLGRYSIADVKRAINQNEFRFAKTMPDNPHYYAVRKNWMGNLPFDDFALLIRKYGYNEKFKGWTYRKWDFGNYSYWSMGAPLALTVIINRKQIV